MQNIYLKNSITIIFLTTPHQHIHLFWYLTLAIFIPPTFLTSNQPTKHAITYALNTRNHTPRGTGQLLDLGLNCYLKIIKPSQTRKPKNTLLRMYHDIHLIRMLLWEVQQQFQQQHPNQLELQTWTVHQGYSLDTPCVQQKDWNRFQSICKSSSLLPWNPPNHAGKDVSRKLYRMCTSTVQILHYIPTAHVCRSNRTLGRNDSLD